jgi:hypothetical protein
VAQAAQRSGIRYIHTDYWMGMGIMFESGARITASSLVGPNRTSYDPKYEQRVLAAEGRDTAFLFRSDGPATPVFEAYLMRRGIQCERIPVQRYILYNGCTPFPSIDHLQSILPEAIGP